MVTADSPLLGLGIQDALSETSKLIFQCQICHKFGHMANRQRHNKGLKTPSIHKALSALQATDLDPEDWIPDSGKSSHTSHNASLFSTLTKYEGANSVMIGNGQFLPISHIVGDSFLSIMFLFLYLYKICYTLAG